MTMEQDQEQMQGALYVAVDDGNKIIAMERSRRGDEGFRALLDEWNIPVVLITHDPASKRRSTITCWIRPQSPRSWTSGTP